MQSGNALRQPGAQPHRYPATPVVRAADQDTYPDRQAVDGQSDTFWVSWGQAAGGSFIDRAVRLGAAVTIGTVSLNAGSRAYLSTDSLPGRHCHAGSQADYGPRDFAVQASDDGHNWTTFTLVTDAT